MLSAASSTVDAMSGPTNWRDDNKVHPAADMFPMMSDAELDELAADIEKNGIQQPIVWLKGQLLDGRNRVAAVHRIADASRRDALLQAWANGKKCILLPFHPDPVAYVVSANIHRRHLTAARKREIVAELLRQKPERSDRATARIANVSHPTVATVRADLEQTGDVEKPSTRTDTAGRQQPAHKTPAEVVHLPTAGAPQPTASAARDKAIAGFSMVLHKHLAKTLNDLTRILASERDRVAEIPLAKRVAFARGYLNALGVSVDDLHPIEGAAP